MTKIAIVNNHGKAVLRVGFLAVTGLLCFSAQANDLSVQQAALQKAEAAMQQADFNTTIDLLTPLHQADPADLTIGNNLAVAYIRQQQYEQAQMVLETVLNKAPKLATLRQNLQQIYAYQAQLAYRNVFASGEITEPKGEWILSADYEVDPSEVAAMKQVQLDIAEVTQQLEVWRSAWAQQNFQKYLDSYLPDYYATDFGNREDWETNRQFSVTGPRYIQVQLDEIAVVPIAQNVMQVSFWQAYESNRFKDKVRKKLLWKKQQGDWKILQETVIYE